MATTDIALLTLIVGAFVIFGVTLATVTWWSGHSRN